MLIISKKKSSRQTDTFKAVTTQLIVIKMTEGDVERKYFPWQINKFVEWKFEAETDLIASLGSPAPPTWHWYSASSSSFTGDIDRDQSPSNVITLNNLGLHHYHSCKFIQQQTNQLFLVTFFLQM